MTAFACRVAELTGVAEDKLERIAGGVLSEVLLLRRPDGRCTVAKGGGPVGAEAAMLRALIGAGAPAPMVEAEHDNVLLLEHIPNDGVFSPAAWADIGRVLRRLHAPADERYGWATDFRISTVEFDNRQGADWPAFWGQQRLAGTASVLDRPWRERIERLVPRLGDLLPAAPPASFLHGDLWTGNILVSEGKLAALIDPAAYYGHSEVDLAMLALFDSPPEAFWDAYGALDPGWEERRPLYQLFPALVHVRLFGSGYETMTDRLLSQIGA
jgi:fructosamine-3-kinase